MAPRKPIGNQPQKGKKATKKPKKAPKRPPEPRRKPKIPTKEELEARRARVRELFGIPDAQIARKLIDEGFFHVPTGRIAPDRAKFEDSVRRTINNDRNAIRQEWRKRPKRTAEDYYESAEEYIARLQTRIEQIHEHLDSHPVKDTPWILAQAELRQLEALIAKARGVAEAIEAEPDEDPANQRRTPFLGVVIDLGRVSPAAIDRARGLLNGKDDDDDGICNKCQCRPCGCGG